MPPVLRIVQLNAGSLLEPGWTERRAEIVAWLDRLSPDLVCLQEIWADAQHDHTAAWIAERLAEGPWFHHFDGRPFAPELWADQSLRFGSAVLSRWPIEAASYHALPVDEDHAGPDELVRRIPWELLHVRTAGLDVFSAHLAAAPPDGLHRQAQVVAIDRIVRDIRGARDHLEAFGATRDEPPAVLCGDFNAEPESDEIRFLSSLTALHGRTTFWQDAWRVAGEGPGWTQDWRIAPLAAALNVNRKRIDYVFVGDPFRRTGGAGRVLRAEMAFDRPLTGVVASDHLGLVVEVQWPQRPAISP